MPNPPLRADFQDQRTPEADELPAAEYNLNAARTDAAYDLAQQLNNKIDGGAP